MALDDDIALLRRIPTFRALGPDGLRVIAISAEQMHLRSGDTLFEEGEPADCAYVVVAGAIRLRTAGSKADEPNIVRAGSMIGEMALMIETDRPAQATALEPSTLMRITRGVFMRMLEGEPKAAALLQQFLRERIGAAVRDLDVVLPRFEQPLR